MSYGSEAAGAASTASEVGSAASTAGSAANTASTISEGALGAGESGTYMNALGQTQPSSFTLGAEQGAMNAGTGPTVANYNLETYGTADPSWLDKSMKFLDEYQKGKEQTLPQAWKNKGMNAQTFGYIGGKMEGMMKGGGASGQATPIIMNNQQPQNDKEYLLRYMLSKRRA